MVKPSHFRHIGYVYMTMVFFLCRDNLDRVSLPTKIVATFDSDTRFLWRLNKECYSAYFGAVSEQFALCVKSHITQKTCNVGDRVTIQCAHRHPEWYKNGTKVAGTKKVRVLTGSLRIYCAELSDNGIYECRDSVIASAEPRKYNVVVNNPDNKEFFHIFNKRQSKCLSALRTNLSAEDCDLQSCVQKWMRSADGKLVHVNSLGADLMCISRNQPVESSVLTLQNCSQNPLRWKCENDLLKLRGYNLYLNYEKLHKHLNLLSSAGTASHWVRYSTRDNICSAGKKAVVEPIHVVKSERETVRVECNGINFYKPLYRWLKNGKIIISSSTSLHIHSNVLLLPFAYVQSSGNYTCVVEDQWGRDTATTVIEIYKDPSVIRSTANQKPLFGKDFCITCEMYANSSTYEISWFKMGKRISSSNLKYNINLVPGVLKKFSTKLCIQSLDLDDNGKYSCEVKHGTKLASDEKNVQVLVKPKVYIYKINDGFLVCNATGFPPPRLAWYKNKELSLRNTNDETSLKIKHTTGNLTCVATNSVGTSSKSSPFYISAASKRGENSMTLIVILCVIGGILLVILIILCVCWYTRRKKEVVNNNYAGAYDVVRYTAAPVQSACQSQYATVDLGSSPQKSHKSRIEFQPRSSSEPGPKRFGLKNKYQSLKPRTNAEWEVPYEFIKFNEKLGEGQFGQVWKGDILSKKGSRTVAIKMLRDGASLKDRKSLIDELEFMKTMSPHPNIVGLVGCCTRTENVMILVEYIPGGNLKDYLFNSRGKSKDIYANLAPFSATLSSKDLLTFAYEIARGMSYLEQIKCVHRDLAARNVLVGDDKTCKIADFGLARDIYAENYYRKTNGGRLPLRWMAYESIFNGITTNQSDAWSFGVVLWEIVTLGGNPYPDMNRDQVIDGLQRGYRMPRPHHCSEEIYSVMWDCWQQNPDKRPTFAELTATFLRLISLEQSFINMESFSEDDYVNVGSYEETEDE